MALALFGLVFPISIWGQVDVDESRSIESSILSLVGEGITVENIRYNGVLVDGSDLNSNQVSFFQNGAGYFYMGSPTPMDTGVIISSGSAVLAETPNNSPSAGSNTGQNYQDWYLNSISSGTTYNAAIVEFDFLAVGTSFQFEYVFASDEYNEFVNTGFNDVFGFFLTGPVDGGPYDFDNVNIALAGDDSEVTINTINIGQNPLEYINNTPPGFDTPANPYLFPDFQFDGLTTILTAQKGIKCGRKYRLKMAVADVGDGIYDTAIFIKGGSLSSNIGIVPDLAVDSAFGDPEGYQGFPLMLEECGFGELVFTRTTDLDLDVWFDLIITGTATNGVDYTLIPDSLFMPAGVGEISLPIDAYPDGIIEGLEVATVYTSYVFSECGSTPIPGGSLFAIDEAEPLEIESLNPSTGCNDSVVIFPDVIGGYGYYNYEWSTGDTTPFITVPGDIETYYLTVTDTCGAAITTQGFTISNNEPELIVEAGEDLIATSCLDSMYLNGLVFGGDGNYSFVWINGLDTISTELSDIYVGNSPSSYQLIVTDGCGTVSDDNVILSFEEDPIITLVGETASSASCLDSVQLSVVATGGAGGYEYAWFDNGSLISTEADFYLQINSSESYTVQVTDACGQVVSDEQATIYAPPPLVVNPGLSDISYDCQDEAELEGFAFGGSPDYTYFWINTTTGDTVSYSESYATIPSETTQYTFVVVDACEVVGTEFQTLFYEPTPLSVEIGEDQTVFACDEVITIQSLVSGGLSDYSYIWQDESGDIISNDNLINVSTNQDQTYTLFVSDQCNDLSIDSITVFYSVPPLTLDVEGDIDLCFEDQLVLTASVGGGVEPYTYSWTGNDNSVLSTEVDLVQTATENTEIYLKVIDHCDSEIDYQQIGIQVEQISALAGFTYAEENLQLVYFTNQSEPDYAEYLWDFGDGFTSSETEPTHEYFDYSDHQIVLTAFTEQGCTDTYILDYQAPGQVFIPNTFTPNGDNHNDDFRVVGTNVKSMNMKIFDRWGRLVKELRAPEDSWSGDFRQTTDASGQSVYNYVLDWTDYRDNTYQKSGSILLLR